MSETISGDLTVNETIQRFPATLTVFKSFGIHTCCGGAEPVAAAAVRDGADPAALLQALREVAG